MTARATITASALADALAPLSAALAPRIKGS
jgi:hypothetical protein